MIYNDKIAFLKALGIVLMVIGHCTYGFTVLRQMIYMFHMPIFFFAAGYCFNRRYLNDKYLFLQKRIKGLYFPVVKWGSLFLILHNVFYNISFYSRDYTHMYDLATFFNEFFILLLGMRVHEPLLGGYWFLHALFWGSIISWILLRYISPTKAILVSVIICIIMNKYQLRIPLIEISPQSFSASVLYNIGHMFAYKKVSYFNIYQIVTSLVLMFIGSFFWRLDMDIVYFSNYKIVPYWITAVLTIWSIMSLVDIITIPKFIERLFNYIGTHTLDILTFHFLSFKLVSLIIIYIYDLSLSRLSDFPVIIEYANFYWWILYSIIGIILPLTIRYCLITIHSKWTNLPLK